MTCVAAQPTFNDWSHLHLVQSPPSSPVQVNKRNNNNTHNTPANYSREQKRILGDMVVSWMQETFEVGVKGCQPLPKDKVYVLYCNYCRLNGWPVESRAACGRLIHKAFPTVECSRKGSRGAAKYHYQNLSVRDSTHNNNTLNTPANYQQTPTTTLVAQPFMEFRSFPFCSEAAGIDEILISGNESPYNSCESSGASSPASNDYLHEHFADFATEPCDADVDMSSLLDVRSLIQGCFDKYYQELLTAFLSGCDDKKVKEVLSGFWSVEMPLLFVESEMRDFFEMERKGLECLLDALRLAKAQKRISVDTISTIACYFPLWITTETMTRLPRDYVVAHMAMWNHFSQRLYTC